MEGQVTTKLVGQVAGGREQVLSAARLGSDVTLVPEPKNPYDSNAIAVHLGAGNIDHDEHTHLGYIPRNIAEKFTLPGPIAGVITNLRYPPHDSDKNPNIPVGADITAPLLNYRRDK